jgi:hypothetical protein
MEGSQQLVASLFGQSDSHKIQHPRPDAEERPDERRKTT